jgi:hypothetical protein
MTHNAWNIKSIKISFLVLNESQGPFLSVIERKKYSIYMQVCLHVYYDNSQSNATINFATAFSYFIFKAEFVGVTKSYPIAY